MRIDLKEYAREMRVFEGPIALDEPRYAPDGIHPVGPARLQLEVRDAGGGYQLEGGLDVNLELECARCLGPVPFQRHVDFRLRLEPAARAPQVADSAVLAEQLEVSYFQVPEIELEDVIQEQIFLIRPMKPVCRPDCLGLCPTCGADRNLGPCGCPEPEPLSPLAALRSLKH